MFLSGFSTGFSIPIKVKVLLRYFFYFQLACKIAILNALNDFFCNIMRIQSIEPEILPSEVITYFLVWVSIVVTCISESTFYETS